jgi:hypothetical protein
MHCENRNHHHPNEGCCDNSPRQHDHNNHEYQRCSMARAEQHAPNHNPHDMHYHINKYAVRAWLMNALYLGLHAVEIYLIIKLV